MRKPTAILNTLSQHGNSAWVLSGDVKRIYPYAFVLGSGYFRTAYRVTRYVIKSAHAHGRRGHTPVKRIRRSGLLPPQQWYANGWVVQPYYRLAPARLIDKFVEDNIDMIDNSEWCYRIRGLDLGYGNTGIDERGRLVAFDW